MAMRGFFIDNGAFEKYRQRIPARRFLRILQKLSDSTMFPDNPDYGDSLFKGITTAECEFWDILRADARAAAKRTLANRENGARGGRPPKTAPQSAGLPPVPKPAPLTPQQKAAGIQTMLNTVAHNMSNKSPYRRILVTPDFDLTKLDDPIADDLRLIYPPNRFDVLTRLSRWLRQPDKFLGKMVDAKWLNDQAKNFADTKK